MPDKVILSFNRCALLFSRSRGIFFDRHLADHLGGGLDVLSALRRDDAFETTD